MDFDRLVIKSVYQMVDKQHISKGVPKKLKGDLKSVNVN